MPLTGQERDSMLFTGQASRASGRHERDSIPLTRQDSKTNGRHNGCDKQPDHIVVTDKPCDTSGNISSPKHKVRRTRSGWAVCMSLWLWIDV